jgi:hypothetical protein
MLRLGLGTCLALLALATSAFATDGVIEINAARAAAGGVTSGDSPGFPVEIFTAGNYRLTSDLVVPAGATGIAVYAAGTRIDLNGFTISSTTTCTGSPLSCAPSGSGVGIDASGADSVAVRTGRVTGFGVYGVFLFAASRASELLVDDNAVGGIVMDEASFVTDCIVRHNGGTGITTGPDSRIAGNVVSANGGPGISAPASALSDRNAVNHNVGPSTAGIRNRRFYLSKNSPHGSGATTACDSGFHMASLSEVLSPSALTYDQERGTLAADTGSGPPTIVTGWIRTGFSSNTSGGTGLANCNAWTSQFAGHVGSTAALNPNWAPTGSASADPATWPWMLSTQPCSNPVLVWCVED